MNSVLTSGASRGTVSIGRWLGLNESGGNGLSLKNGEAEVMRNFCVRRDGALAKRPGYKRLLRLWPEFQIVYGEEKELLREVNTSCAQFNAGHDVTAVFGGRMALTGENFLLTAENADLHMDSCFEMADGRMAKLTAGVWRVTDAYICHATDRHVDGGWVRPTEETVTDTAGCELYGNIRVRSGTVETVGEAVEDGSYVNLHGRVWQRRDDGAFTALEAAANDLFCWWGKEISLVPEEGVNTHPAGLWSGTIGRMECIMAACGGRLWSAMKRNGTWYYEQCANINTSDDVCMFGFGGKLYIITQDDYYSWDGSHFESVAGYVPCLAVASSPQGGGKLYERANLLTASRSQRFSADGTSKTYVLLEKDIAGIEEITVNGQSCSSFTANLAKGEVTFTTAPAAGTDNVEIRWSAARSNRQQVISMRHAELFNGSTDTRVFLYGDMTNRVIYSDLTGAGEPTAEYFPELNVCSIGTQNSPVSALLRHFDRLLAFKTDSTYSISYSAVTLADGTVTGGFYVKPINRITGNCAFGQALLVGNRPRTVDGRSVYEWVPGSTGLLTTDQTNAAVISQRVAKTLAQFEGNAIRCFYDRLRHEYYCVCGSRALVHNTEKDCWYEYDDFPAVSMVEYGDEIYLLTKSGELAHLSEEYCSDNEQPINALWVGGKMSLGRDNMRKYVTGVWLGLEPGEDSRVSVSVEDSEGSTRTVEVLGGREHLKMRRVPFRTRAGEYAKLSFASDSAHRAAIVSCQVEVSMSGEIR